MKKKKSFFKRFLLFVFFFFLVGVTVTIYWGYELVYKPNVSIDGHNKAYFYIRTGSSFNDVINHLSEQNIIINRYSFERLSAIKGYKNRVKAGRYLIKERMNNNQLINMFRAGLQEPVQITFNMIRTKQQLVSRIGKRLEADSIELMNLLNNIDFVSKYGFNRKNILSLFIPNTYEMYWNTSAVDFMERMIREYKGFWNTKRRARARELNLSPAEVSVLASIVQAEQSRFDDEKPVIAGLYFNRLKSGMPLQSDPTLIYALGDFTISRVLNGDKKIDSPYNTYKNKGLPPGPICLPEISSIDAVLNYQKNDYFYMCAKEDFSGRHNFSETMAEHSLCAKRYREALDQHNIKR
jgi:UPF0755 protein